MKPELIFACIAIIVVGVAVIMYTLLRSSKPPVQIGKPSSIDLGDEVPDEEEETADAEESTEDMATEENAE